MPKKQKCFVTLFLYLILLEKYANCKTKWTISNHFCSILGRWYITLSSTKTKKFMSKDYASRSPLPQSRAAFNIKINLVKILIWANNIVEWPSSHETGFVRHFEFSYLMLTLTWKLSILGSTSFLLQLHKYISPISIR